MTEEQLKAFIEKVQGDESLKEKLNAAADLDAILAVAKEAGFMIPADVLKNAQSEISQEELENAAGGGGKNECKSKGTWCALVFVHCYSK